MKGMLATGHSSESDRTVIKAWCVAASTICVCETTYHGVIAVQLQC